MISCGTGKNEEMEKRSEKLEEKEKVFVKSVALGIGIEGFSLSCFCLDWFLTPMPESYG